MSGEGIRSMLRPTDLVEELRKQPFEPFRIHVSDGSAYEVRHPEWVMVSPSRVLVFVPLAGQPHPLFERYHTIALLHITRLEPLEGLTTSGPNGPAVSS